MRELIRYVLDRTPYVKGLRDQVRNVGCYPAGHFYSPIPSAADVAARLDRLNGQNAGISGINLKSDAQLRLLQEFERFYPEMPFPQAPRTDCRYHFAQTVFCYADAIFLYSFLRHQPPKRIIEVGSGFSSAVLLDTVDRFFPHPPEITFIEPFPVTLRRVLRPEDYSKTTLIEDQVQRVPMERFKSLQAGDLLFIDSSHVMKCGSDVQFLMFDVLPQLAVGVVVHFHDVFEKFEYLAGVAAQGLVLERRLRTPGVPLLQLLMGDLSVRGLCRQDVPRLLPNEDAAVPEESGRKSLHSADGLGNGMDRDAHDLFHRRGDPPRDAVLIDDAGVPVSVRFVFGLALARGACGQRPRVGGVDILDPEVERSGARRILPARLGEHDERVADLDFRVHDGVVLIPLTRDFRAVERRRQERQLAVGVGNEEIGSDGAIRVFDICHGAIVSNHSRLGL